MGTTKWSLEWRLLFQTCMQPGETLSWRVCRPVDGRIRDQIGHGKRGQNIYDRVWTHARRPIASHVSSVAKLAFDQAMEDSSEPG